jgi:AraC-like DNA-binding protein
MNDAYAIALLPQRERFEFFRGVVDRVFCPMQVQPSLQPGQTFGGSIAVTDFRGIRLAHVATSACFVRRRAEDIARISSPGYLVKFQLKGRSLWTQRGRQLQLTPGDFVICSTTEPYSLRFLEAYSMPVIGLSNQTMHDLTPHPNRFLGVRMNGEEADCGLLSSFVSQVVVRMGQLSEPMLGRVEANILDLLGAVLTTRSDKTPKSAAMQLRRIKVYVQSHLRDPRMSTAMIATEFGISARYVHALFRDEPITLGNYIRSLRLAECRRALEENPAGEQSLTDLALHWGFYDLSHMSRCFREEFRLTPREFRKRAAQSAAAARDLGN